MPMKPREFIVLIIYDIVDNRRRTKMVKCLEAYAVRVQKSAFEGRLTKKQYERLITKSVRIIDENTDSLRVYILDDVLDCYSWGVKADTDGTCVIV